MSAVRRFIATTELASYRSGGMPRSFHHVVSAAFLAFGLLMGPAFGQGSVRLIDAVTARDDAALEKSIADGANLEQRDARGRTALLIATYENNVAAATALVAAGADVNAKDSIQDTPYLYAAAEGRLEILELCLQNEANLRDTNRFGGTGLIPAADRGHVEIVRRLLSTDIDVDHINRLGWTALLEAVILGDGGPRHQEIVRLLVDAGAKPIADNDGVTPLDHARQRGFAEMVETLQGK